MLSRRIRSFNIVANRKLIERRIDLRCRHTRHRLNCGRLKGRALIQVEHACLDDFASQILLKAQRRIDELYLSVCGKRPGEHHPRGLAPEMLACRRRQDNRRIGHGQQRLACGKGLIVEVELKVLKADQLLGLGTASQNQPVVLIACLRRRRSTAGQVIQRKSRSVSLRNALADAHNIVLDGALSQISEVAHLCGNDFSSFKR